MDKNMMVEYFRETLDKLGILEAPWATSYQDYSWWNDLNVEQKKLVNENWPIIIERFKPSIEDDDEQYSQPVIFPHLRIIVFSYKYYGSYNSPKSSFDVIHYAPEPETFDISDIMRLKREKYLNLSLKKGPLYVNQLKTFDYNMMSINQKCGRGIGDDIRLNYVLSALNDVEKLVSGRNSV